MRNLTVFLIKIYFGLLLTELQREHNFIFRQFFVPVSGSTLRYFRMFTLPIGYFSLATEPEPESES